MTCPRCNSEYPEPRIHIPEHVVHACGTISTLSGIIPSKICDMLVEREGRIIELESAIRWWYTEKMRDYNDNQYGKAQLKRILNINPLVAPLE